MRWALVLPQDRISTPVLFLPQVEDMSISEPPGHCIPVNMISAALPLEEPALPKTAWYCPGPRILPIYRPAMEWTHGHTSIHFPALQWP